jgi:hypothetical protein
MNFLFIPGGNTAGNKQKIQFATGAPTGHTSAQVPQPWHNEVSTIKTPFFSEMAPSAHSFAQAPQAMHSSVIV